MEDNHEWRIYLENGNGCPNKEIRKHLVEQPGPPWRRFDAKHQQARGQNFVVDPQQDAKVVNAVNASLYLRRPLLVRGKSGTGKSSLAYAVAYELGLGPVLRWGITSRSTLKEGLYAYDAVGRLAAEQNPEEKGKYPIGEFIRLGPLGTAFATSQSNQLPRALLIDEIDKCDMDLVNDLLHIFEEGYFTISELERLADHDKDQQIMEVRCSGGQDDSDKKVKIEKGRVTCENFPFILMTSNGERDFPAPFLRRCIRVTIPEAGTDKLKEIVKGYFGHSVVENDRVQEIIEAFIEARDKDQQTLSTDQILNAIYLIFNENIDLDIEHLKDLVLNSLSTYNED